MTMKRLIAATFGAILTGTALSGASVAQDAPAKSGKLADFNNCVETNASVLIPQGDLVQLCLTQHASPMDRALVNAQGSYRQTENGMIFLLRMQNTSPDMIMTGYSVILKHQKAEQPQVFTFSPVSILPGGVVDVPLGGLAFVPDAADLASDQFQFGVDGVSGVALSLN